MNDCANQMLCHPVYFKQSRVLTLKCLSYFSLRLCTRGSTWTRLFEYLPVGTSVRNLHHMCMHLRQPWISKKNGQKSSFQNGGQKKRIFVLRRKSCDQNLKNYFPKGILTKFVSKLLKNINTFTFLIKSLKKKSV